MRWATEVHKRGDERRVKKFAWWPTLMAIGSSSGLGWTSLGAGVWLEHYEQLDVWWDDSFDGVYKWRTCGRVPVGYEARRA